jgi:ferredoxin
VRPFSYGPISHHGATASGAREAERRGLPHRPRLNPLDHRVVIGLGLPHAVPSAGRPVRPHRPGQLWASAPISAPPATTLDRADSSGAPEAGFADTPYITATFRRSCAHGIYGSDAIRINGRNPRLQDADQGHQSREAHDNEPTPERLQTAEERERFDDTTKCILCAACTASCPVFWNNGRLPLRHRGNQDDPGSEEGPDHPAVLRFLVV